MVQSAGDNSVGLHFRRHYDENRQFLFAPIDRLFGLRPDDVGDSRESLIEFLGIDISRHVLDHGGSESGREDEDVEFLILRFGSLTLDGILIHVDMFSTLFCVSERPIYEASVLLPLFCNLPPSLRRITMCRISVALVGGLCQDLAEERRKLFKGKARPQFMIPGLRVVSG
jgi:hypothetical protein